MSILFYFHGSRERVSGAGHWPVSAPRRSSTRKNQGGFTLIEMVVTMALVSILFITAVGGYRYFSANRALDVAAREVRSQIREAQAMAVSTGNTHRVFFDVSGGYFVMQKRQGSEWVNAAPAEDLPSAVEFDSSSPPNFDGDGYIEFYARGTSESGSLVLQNRNSQMKTISVDGETVNVTESG